MTIIQKPVELRNLQPMQIGKTHNVKKAKKLLYILLKKDNEHYTVFTTEGNGFVMTCRTKNILVDVCFTPEGENQNLTNYSYPNKLYESLRQRAIAYLNNPDKPLKLQGKWVQFETKANLSNQRNDTDNRRSLRVEDILTGIEKLEKEAKVATPLRKKRIAYQIERGTIAKRVKKLAYYKCLVCEALGLPPVSFIKRNSNIPYVETHHVEGVSLLKAGSLALHNLITVCANHHRQFHYGNLEVTQHAEQHFYFEIDGTKGQILKLKIS